MTAPCSAWGTVIGAGVVWIVLTQDPSIWTVVALVACLQVVIEMVIGANYALGQIFVTPLALLMSYLASNGGAGATMVGERVLDTLAGAVIGILLAVVSSPLTTGSSWPATMPPARARRPDSKRAEGSPLRSRRRW